MVTEDRKWIGTVNPELAREAMNVLEDMIREYDIGRPNPVRISAYPPDAPDMMIGNETAWLKARGDAVEMLRNNRILRAADRRYVGGSPYVRDEDRGEWWFIDAEATTVREIAAALRARLYRPNPPAAPRAVAPASATTIYNAPVTNVHSYGDNAELNVTVQTNDLKAIAEFIKQVEAKLGDLRLPVPKAIELVKELEALKHATREPAPKRGPIRRGMDKVLGFLGQAGISVVVQGLTKLGTEALKHLIQNPPA